ncbi:hypothetical protein HDU98_000598 [Podochytrium sp. JEL0797]|nr:hypothetical protein HDU98_000598 [Podochytrium sp. JEL0797]
MHRTTVAAILVPTALVVFKLFIHPFFLHPLRNIRGPKAPWWATLLGLGSSLSFMTNTQSENIMTTWSKQFGPMFKLNLWFNEPTLFICSQSAVKRVLATNVENYPKPAFLMRGLHKILGEQGLVTVEGKMHKKQRALMNPLFRVKQIQNMMPIFVESAVQLCATVTKKLDTSATLGQNGTSPDAQEEDTSVTMNITKPISNATLDVIGRAGFSYDFHALQNQQDNDEVESELSKATLELGKYIGGLSGLMLAMFPGVATVVSWLPLPRERRIRHAEAELRRVCREILEARQKEIRECDPNDPSPTAPKDILSLLIQANQGESRGSSKHMSDGEVMDQILTFMAAGRATSAVATQWILYHLSLDLEVQSRLRDELREQLVDPVGEISADWVMGGNSILDAVMKEGLRVSSPIPRTARMAVQDDILDGVRIPKGTILIMSSDALHKNKEFWGPDADEFNPSRWLDAKNPTTISSGFDAVVSQPDAQGSFFSPFLSGPRNCIGAKFATTEIKVLVAYLVRNFEFTPPVGGFKFEIRRRNVMFPFPHLELNVRKVV